MRESPRWQRRALCLCLAAWLHLPAQASDGAPAQIARIEAAQPNGQGEFDRLTLSELMARLQVPGLSVAVVKDFKLHWAKGYGSADAATGRRVDPATRFQAASISKPVMALAALRLAQSARLDLDGDINLALTSWKVPVLPGYGPVSARALLSHTSGADDGFGFPGYEPGAPLPHAVQILEGQAPSNVGKVTFGRPAFAASRYSGAGATIMQQALSDLSGQPFARLMQASVLGPLRMSHSSYQQALPGAQAVNAALAHDARGSPMAAPWRVHPELAAAGLWSTPSDLARVLIEIQTAVRGPRGQILDQRFARDMVTPVGVGRYGLGPAIDQRGDGWYFSHGGSNWGYRAYLIGHLRKGYGFVVMTNGDNGSALIDPLADRIANAYGWDSMSKPLAQ